MKIKYTGRQGGLAPAQLKKLESRFAKIGKLLDGRRECEAHVVLSVERHLQQAEATVNYYGHPLVGLGSSPDLFTAIHSAAEKLEKQALKARTKWRDNKRGPKQEAPDEPAPQAAPPKAKAKAAREPEPERLIYHVNHHEKRKPMTLDEAVLEMEKKRDYVVYRDAATDRVSVLVRRPDGNFDLVEG
ncbi:MAG TPA: ribosome-associated translation inhibitor RaiA [Bryobacteraceae bacterium]|nr:ribosome-associated translation inhibitor RaiA [Bryobacteraceae bacterium]